MHKHLLCKRSDKLKTEVEISMAQKPKGELNWGGDIADPASIYTYIAFLYGQPMWTYTPEEQVDVDVDYYLTLMVHDLSTHYEDHDAADA